VCERERRGERESEKGRGEEDRKREIYREVEIRRKRD